MRKYDNILISRAMTVISTPFLKNFTPYFVIANPININSFSFSYSLQVSVSDASHYLICLIQQTIGFFPR